VFLFIAGLAAICFITIAAFFLITEIRDYDIPPPISEGAHTASEEEEDLRVHVPYSTLTVGEYTYLELRSGKDSGGKSLSYSKSQTRNIAVYNLKTDTTHWVFEGAKQEIEQYKPVRKETIDEEGEQQSIIQAFLITKSTRRLDGSINRELWIMTPNGKVLNKLLPQISKAPKIEYFGETIKLIVKADKNIIVYPLNIEDLTIGEAVKISTP
jgi:hypothetical protein